MPTRTGAEKAKTEKRIRTEKIIMTVVGALALAAFLILGILSSRKTGCFELYPEITPFVTDDPTTVSANYLNSVYGGDVTSGDGIYLINFQSKADGCDTAVRIYKKSGIECIEIVRQLGVVVSTPEPKDIFGSDNGSSETSYSVLNIEKVADELADILSAVYKTEDYSVFKNKICETLLNFTDGKTVKSSFLFGSYIVKTELNGTDALFTVTIEPA